ncbi:hypothetical protein KK141_19105 [Dyella sp. LX-66]|uniref:hypothetical protein n=1 Tax=unclassified Dyella TaxID=2634549 RepID=UPI001BE07B57|nr:MULTISPECIES: hypothetical protein [unclassified Dyella]MBT2119293.1 hypothetical protein [Dyella sp. LX-1]MBT2141664.1 hypothetical protein [Dyella sp. LX-66]
MGSENKPRTADGYGEEVTGACEQALITLLGAFGTLGDDLRLIGGLAPRYLTPANPPEVPAHAGTTDVDIVLDLAVIGDGENYASLAAQLTERGFRRHMEGGRSSSWQWRLDVGAIPVLVELLSDGGNASRPKQVPLAGEDVSTMAMPHAGMARDWFITRELTAQAVGGGVLTRRVHVADVPAFVILKALALNRRYAPKDAADLIHVLQYAGSIEEMAGMFVGKKQSGLHGASIDAGIEALQFSFVHPSRPELSHTCDGPVKYAGFHYAAAGEEALMEAQRFAANLVRRFLARYEVLLKEARKSARRIVESDKA